jgi:hypothetical protein
MKQRTKALFMITMNINKQTQELKINRVEVNLIIYRDILVKLVLIK